MMIPSFILKNSSTGWYNKEREARKHVSSPLIVKEVVQSHCYTSGVQMDNKNDSSDLITTPS